MLRKITISPESTNYGDNDANVAYLYRGYIIWKSTQVYVGDRGGNRDEWNYGPAVLHTPNASLGETFEPYWDDNGDADACESRRDCVAVIDKRLDECRVARLAWEAEQAPRPDPDAVENVTLTVSLNQARTILAALSDRHDVVQGRFKEEAGQGLLTAAARTEALASEIKALYQSVDRQVFQAK